MGRAVSANYFEILACLLITSFHRILACPPQGIGNCYAGSYSGGAPSFYNQKCAADGLREWCAVTYQPKSNLGNFGCASSFQRELGEKLCGDGQLSINDRGCDWVNTPEGPCYLCCCKGGSCNHPRSFAEYAQVIFSGSNGFENPNVYWNSSFSRNTVIAMLIVFYNLII